MTSSARSTALRTEPCEARGFEQVADRIQQPTAIADAPRSRPNGVELLARRLPAAGANVVEADDDPDDLVRRRIIRAVELRPRRG